MATTFTLREPLSSLGGEGEGPAARPARPLDPVLEAYRRAPQAEADELLGDLLTRQALPVIRGVLRRGASPSPHDQRDLESEAMAILVERLGRLRNPDAGAEIGDLRAYAAVVAFNVVSAQRRRAYREAPRAAGPGPAASDASQLPDRSPNAAARVEDRSSLHQLWQEIRLLPERQALALLLNLRDEGRGNAIVLLPLTGVASLREIAGVLGMPAERLAELWPRLPLDDATIAEILGISRQQVINLRKSARERLSRRLRSA